MKAQSPIHFHSTDIPFGRCNFHLHVPVEFNLVVVNFQQASPRLHSHMHDGVVTKTPADLLRRRSSKIKYLSIFFFYCTWKRCLIFCVCMGVPADHPSMRRRLRAAAMHHFIPHHFIAHHFIPHSSFITHTRTALL